MVKKLYKIILSTAISTFNHLVHVCDKMSSEMFKARYDNYRLVRVHLESAEHVTLFTELEAESDSFTYYGHALRFPQSLTILVAAHKIYEFQDIVDRYHVKWDVLQQNIQNLIDAEKSTIKPKGTPAEDFDWNHYHHLETIFRWMDKQISENDFVTGFEIGKTYEGKPIRGLKISKQEGNTGVFIDSGIHAREWIAPAVATYTINQLIHSKDPAIVDLALNFDWYFVPVLNADGYVNTFEKDRLWRKNTKPYGRCRGVDLNRNFDINWGGTGASHNKTTYDFCGSEAFSEPEAKAIKDFLDKHTKDYRIQTYFSLHSFSQLYMFPYGYNTEKVKNYEDLKKIGAKAVEAIKDTHGKVYVAGSSIETIYPNSGTSMDYVYEHYDIPITFTIELRGDKSTPTFFTMASDTDENKARYDFYRLIRLSLENEEQVSVLQEVEVSSDSYTFYGQATKAPQDLMILVPAHKIYEIQDIIERFKIKFKILERNVQKLIDDEKATIKPKNTSADDFGWDHYYHLDTIYRWMDKLINDNEFVTAFDLGKTHEGILIRGLKISKQKGNTGVFVEAGIHAREWIAPAVATYTINELIHSKDPAIVDLALNFDWYFVPVLNADGYVITFEKDRFWRRNTQPYGRCRGVDLNRNFDKIGERAVEGIRKVHGRIYDTGSTFETIYQNSGSSVDYAYENYDIPIAFTIELRGPRDTPNLFLLPADEIKPTSEEILSSFVAVLNEARTL
ncbi:CLUMA_CG010030, isoform A, partial [Clunio marinus]